MTGGAQLRDQLADSGKGALERVEAGELAADMDGNALDLEAGKRRGARISVERVADRDAELVLGGTGGDLGVAARGDVGIDPEAHWSVRPIAMATADSISASASDSRLNW